MFRMIHNYNPIYTRALIESGIVNEVDGFKITQHCLTPKNRCFNVAARRGGELFDLVSQYKTCFYIDRLHGGTYYSEYDYDLGLVEEYDKLTNGGFLGFQVHELGLTRKLDWNRIKTQMEKLGFDEWSEENIIKAVEPVSANKQFLHFSSGSPAEYANTSMPQNEKEYNEDVISVIRSRLLKTGGRVLLCDSCFMTCGFDKLCGVKLGFAEVGKGTPFTKAQLALRRGVSCALGNKWGAYYEPWGGSPFSCYNYMKNNENEWYITNENFGFHFYQNGGSSMSLARRMMYYVFFSGASYLSEEWGQANTFYDWESFELTPYGQIKKQFNSFVRRFGEIVPFVPVAIVLPHEIGLYNVLNFGTDNRSFDIKDLFTDGITVGTEDDALTNSKYGSIFDILFDDTTTDICKKYKLVIDFSGKIKGQNCVDGNNHSDTRRALDTLLCECLPFELDCKDNVDFVMFSDGEEKYICIFNHAGISKSVEHGEQVDEKATRSVTLSGDKHAVIEVTPISGSGYELCENRLTATLRGGDILLVKYR